MSALHASATRSFALLAAHGLSFDAHANWFQLEGAAAFFAAFPDTTIILDHLGCPKLDSGSEEEDAARIAVWRRGMRALAALPHVRRGRAFGGGTGWG